MDHGFIVHTRKVQAGAAMVWVVYGLTIHAFPVVVTNLVVANLVVANLVVTNLVVTNLVVAGVATWSRLRRRAFTPP